MISPTISNPRRRLERWFPRLAARAIRLLYERCHLEVVPDVAGRDKPVRDLRDLSRVSKAEVRGYSWAVPQCREAGPTTL